MIWILATRGTSTILREPPYTETTIDGTHGVVYKPGITPIPCTGSDAQAGPLGTYSRGLHRAAGFVFSYNGSAAETLFAVEDRIDLIIRYRANGQARKRKLKDVLFVGDATVTVPGLGRGVSELVGVPFRIQIPETATLADHIEDTVDS
jgi:hypothetical protein